MSKEDRNYKLGISAGLSEASSYLMRYALNLFQKGDRHDAEAKQYRLHADELAKMSDAARPPAPKPCPPIGQEGTHP